MKKSLLFLLFLFVFSCSIKDEIRQNEKDDELADIADTDSSTLSDPDSKNDDDPGDTGDSGDSGNSGNTGDSGNSGDSADSGNSGDSGNTGNTGNTGDTANDEDEITDEEPYVEIPCMFDTDCPGSNRGCFLGKCRDRCTIFVNPCEWKPSGDICVSSFCVECQKDSDCLGTRYTCDKSNYTCVDKPFDPEKTKIGVFYHTWHCPSAETPYDISKILAGQASWPAWPSQPFPPTSFWWGEPADGYYCLTNNTALLKKHAELLRDMGADFVFVDVTNHPYNTGTLCDRPEQMILQPFDTMVQVWSTVEGAPKIVPWVPVTTAYSSDKSKYMVYTLQNTLNSYPGMQFIYQGKPLVIVTENDQWPVDVATETSLKESYTVRRMWAFESEGTEKWSYIERCPASPLEGRPCLQRISKSGGLPEEFPIALAYGADYMSHKNTATPKYYGKTFRKQFETLFNNPEIPVALIAGWNEWVVGRQPCDLVPLCPCSDPQNANGCFLDQYDAEYNRDIEPSKNVPGDYYYRLAKACIKLFRNGKRCDAAHANDLCCKDYQ